MRSTCKNPQQNHFWCGCVFCCLSLWVKFYNVDLRWRRHASVRGEMVLACGCYRHAQASVCHGHVLAGNYRWLQTQCSPGNGGSSWQPPRAVCPPVYLQVLQYTLAWLSTAQEVRKWSTWDLLAAVCPFVPPCWAAYICIHRKSSRMKGLCAAAIAVCARVNSQALAREVMFLWNRVQNSNRAMNPWLLEMWFVPKWGQWLQVGNYSTS